MIIKSFQGYNVYGYLDFDIEFNRDINFLIGRNGSGKTTALRLINALLSQDYTTLLKTEYDKISVSIEVNSETITVESIYQDFDKTKILRVSNSYDEIKLPGKNDFYGKDFINELYVKHSEHDVTKKIAFFDKPVFLGLDRKSEDNALENNSYFKERNVWLTHSFTKGIRTVRKNHSGSLANSLMDTEFLVQNAYKRLKSIEERKADKLRDSLILSIFDYTILEPEDLAIEINKWNEKQDLLERKQELIETLINLGFNKTILVHVENYFEKLTQLFDTLSSHEVGVNIEWLLNKAQIDRISRILERIDQNKSDVDNIFKPINEFIKTMNDFYNDSNKQITIDPVGQLSIWTPNGVESTIDCLSSGERQLLIIFANAYFRKFNPIGKNRVFIIDEPELSLHLDWQEKLSETIARLNDGSQFILATHSPEIVGINKYKSVKCR